MNLELVSWNGNPINDKVDYSTYILPESKFDLSTKPVYTDRAQNYPNLSGVVLPAHSFTFKITIMADDEETQDSLREQLKGWFSPLDFTPHYLVAKDTNDNDTQYQLTGMTARLTPESGAGSGYVTFLITIAITEPIWQKVTATTNTWNATATGQQRTLRSEGNTFSLPIFTIKPTSPRTGQFQYSRWVPVYNPITTPLVNYPIDATNGGLSTTGLVTDTSKSNQINQVGGITAVATTIPIDTAVGGGLPTVGFGIVDSEQISWTGNTGTNLTGVTRGLGGTTAAVHADNAVIKNSKMLANGSDIAVQIDGALVNMWIDGANTASTKVWFNSNWQSGYQGTLLTALANNSSDTTVAFTRNTTNLNALKALKTARNSVFLIGSEAFTFDPANVDLVNYQITSCKRAQKFTSAASHAVAAPIIWIEHDIWLLYGNSSGSSLVVDDTQKPLLNLNTSTNTSWVFANFYDTASARPGQWNGAVLKSAGNSSLVYTGNQTALANPSTELGMRLINYAQANIWKAETATIAWSFYHPCGITTVSIAGSKRLITGTAWPSVAGLQKSSNGSAWLTVWTEAIPSPLNTWSNFTHNAQSLSGTYNNIRVALVGTIQALANNEADIQMDTVTLTLDNTKTPVVSLNSENNIYYLNLKITNTNTGEFIQLTYTMSLNHTLTVDCQKKTVIYDDNSNAIAARVVSTVRNNWLAVAPGDNVFQIDDSGIANMTITTTWYDRVF